MVYDSNAEQIGVKLPKDIKLIVISEYIAKELIMNKIPIEIIYDWFKISRTNNQYTEQNGPFEIAIVGRVSSTKEIDKFHLLIDELKERKKTIKPF